MQVMFDARNPDAGELRDQVLRRTRFVIGRLSWWVARARVRLTDLNGPRGGVDKGCRLHLRLGGLPDVLAEDTAQDLYAAVTRSAARARRNLKRRIARTRETPLARARIAGLDLPA